MLHADFDEDLYQRLVEMDAARIRFGNHYFREDFSERRFGRAIALCNRTRPAEGLFNRVIGFGDDELDALDEIIGFYSEDGIATQIDMCPHRATPGLIAKLGQAGFRPMGTCSVFRGVPEIGSVRVDGIRVEEARGRTVVEWIELHRRLGDKPKLESEEVEARAAFHAAHPEYRLFFAQIAEERVAVGALLLHGDVCHLSNACTDLTKRGLGCQRALLLHRLDVAARNGATLAVTDTMFGTSSHRNAERVGFRLAYNPVFWVRRTLR